MRGIVSSGKALPALVLALVLLLAAGISLLGIASASPEWSEPVNISDSPDPSYRPDIAIDSSGNRHAVWTDLIAGAPTVLYATSADGVSWSEAVWLYPRWSWGHPAIAIDSEDNLHVVFDSYYIENIDEIFYTTSADGETWSPGINISNNDGESRYPAISIDSHNNLHVVWQDDTTDNWEIYYATFDGETWSTPLNISNNEGISERPAIARDSEDNLHVVWQDLTPGNWEIYYATSADGTSWSEAVNISSNEGGSWYPAIAIGSDLHVVWEDTSTGNYEIVYATSADGTSWSEAVNISNSEGISREPAIAIGSDLHVVWEDDTPGSYEIYYATSADGVSWSEAVNISSNEGESRYPAIAIGSGLHVVWQDDTGDNQDIYYAATAPLEADFSAEPTEVKACEYVNFTHNITGGFTPYNYQWDFGDGNTSTEANPSHHYAGPGTYTVSLNVTDAHNNTDTEIKIDYITVAAAPGGLSTGAIVGIAVGGAAAAAGIYFFAIRRWLKPGRV